MSLESEKPSSPRELLHNQFQKIMEKEVEALRALLANMIEEEHSLVGRGVVISKEELWSRREKLTKEIRAIRKHRRQSTHALLVSCFGDHDRSAMLSSEDLVQVLQHQVENGWETLSLREQALLLSEKIKRQRGRNKIFFSKDTYAIKPELKKETRVAKKWTMVEERVPD